MGLFHTYQHPEIIVFGLNVASLQQIIDTLGQKIASGKEYRPGEELTDALEGYACTFLPVDKVWHSEYFGYAEWFYKGDDFLALECVWPDNQQKYPWQEGFAEPLRPKQPLLILRGEIGGRTNP